MTTRDAGEGRCVHVCSFTDFADLVIESGGRRFRFEFSYRFGPAMLDKRGNVVDRMPPMRSPFWDALQAWCQQGHQAENGRCVYVPPPVRRYVALVGRNYVEVPEGADPAAVRREWFERAGLPLPGVAVKVVSMRRDTP